MGNHAAQFCEHLRGLDQLKALFFIITAQGRARYQDDPAAFEALLERSHLILWSERPAGIGEFDHRHILVHVIRQLAARQGIRVNYRGELHPESRMGSYERIMRLMIAGSRQATPDMLAAADRTVRQDMIALLQTEVCSLRDVSQALHIS